MKLGRTLEQKIHEACERGMHVTTRNFGGVTFAIIHEPTDEARQKAIDELDKTEAKA